MTLLQRIDTLPPFCVFALARDKRKRPPLDELVRRSGLSLRTFTRIARRYSWAGVKVCQVDAFCKACNVDLMKQYPQRDFIRHSLQRTRGFSHLNKRQWDVFDKQCAVWRDAIKASAD